MEDTRAKWVFRVLAVVTMVALGLPVLFIVDRIASKVMILIGVAALGWFIGWCNPEMFSGPRPPRSLFRPDPDKEG